MAGSKQKRTDYKYKLSETAQFLEFCCNGSEARLPVRIVNNSSQQHIQHTQGFIQEQQLSSNEKINTEK